jgi:hypothetical protein
MSLSIISGVLAFVLWCTTDTSLKPDHVRSSNGRITFWGTISIVFVQLVIWTLVGFFAAWIVPHLPRFFLAGWRFPVTLLGSSIVQWFALLMIIQYLWTILRPTLSTAVVAMMAMFGSQWAKRELDNAPGPQISVGQKLLKRGAGK